MFNGLQLKICGITSASHAEAAAAIGVDYLGFNFYPKSPRYISPLQFQAIEPRLPKVRRVAVMVEPSGGEFAQAIYTGFEFFQIHFRHDLALAHVEGWAMAVGRERLWL